MGTSHWTLFFMSKNACAICCGATKCCSERAVEISQANAERAAKGSEKFTPALELSLIEKTYEILQEVNKTGKMSDANKAFLTNFLKRGEAKKE